MGRWVSPWAGQKSECWLTHEGGRGRVRASTQTRGSLVHTRSLAHSSTAGQRGSWRQRQEEGSQQRRPERNSARDTELISATDLPRKISHTEHNCLHDLILIITSATSDVPPTPTVNCEDRRMTEKWEPGLRICRFLRCEAHNRKNFWNPFKKKKKRKRAGNALTVSYLFPFTIFVVNVRQHKVDPAASVSEVHRVFAVLLLVDL